MIDDNLNLYILRNKLFHLDYDFDDELILELWKRKDFKNYEKLDILYLMYYSNQPLVNEYSNEEVQERCSLIIDKANNLSEYTYTEVEINNLKKLYYLNCIIDTIFTTSSQIEIINLINDLNNIIEEDILKEKILDNFINEELRLKLLQLCQWNGDIYRLFENIIEYHLEQAQKYIEFRKEITELLFK